MIEIRPEKQEAKDAAAAAAAVISKKAAAESSTPNEFQNHSYSEDATAGHIQTGASGIGEDLARTQVEQKQGGRKVSQPEKSDGKTQSSQAARASHVKANQEASAKLFDSKRKSVNSPRSK